MKIIYTKGRIALFTLSLLVALLIVNQQATARVCVPPTISATSTDITCHGDNNGTATVTVSGGTTPYTFSWTSSTGFTYSTPTISGLDSGSYTVVVTEGGGCTATATVIVTQPPVLDVVTSSNAPFCPGNTLSLYSVTNGGTPGYNYAWSGPAGFTSTVANPDIVNATAANDGVYTLVVTDAHGCTNTNTFSVLLYPAPNVNLGADPYICAGTPITLDAGNPGSTYVWNTGAPTQVITVTTVGNYYVTATNFYGCTGSDSVLVSASPYVTPTVDIAESVNNICAGTSVTFTATAVNGGTAPSFLWRKNGVIVGTSASTYTDATLNNGDYITTRLTSNFACAAPSTAYSDTIRMNVTANVPTAVAVSHLPDTACSGTPLTFTATPFNGGTAPYYQWLRGGVVVGTGNTYIYSPTVSEPVTVQMVSSIVCHTPDTASNTTSFVMYPHLVPSAVITYTPNDTVAFIGQVITFYCEETFGGIAPTYQWYVDRVAVPGATNSTYARHVYNNDTVKCVVNSVAVCAIPRRDTSNTVIIYATFLDVKDINSGNTNVSLYPNPTTGNFTINGTVGIKTNNEVMIEVRDLKGSIVYRTSIQSQNGKINAPLSPGNNLAEGMYLLRLTSDADEQQLKLIIKK